MRREFLDVPESPPSLLPGRSAKSLARRMVLGGSIALAAAAVTPLITGVADDTARRNLLDIDYLIMGIATVLTFFVGAALFVRRQRSELEAGYTTLQGKNFGFWQLDDRTGEVLRRPGERSRVRPSARDIQ